MNAIFRSILWVVPCLFIACSKKSDETAGATPSTEPTPAATAEASAASDVAANQVASTLADLTQAVRKYGAEKQRVPKDLNELVAAGYLPSVPAAPAGKKFAINKQMEVYLADQ
jgi:hypothetical protein